MFEFSKQNIMINSIESFFKIYENSATIQSTVNTFFNFFRNLNKKMGCWILFLKPNWFSYNMLWTSRKWYNLLCISFSIILSKIDKSEIGRKLLTSWVDPPLWSGMTLATFRTSGKTPQLKDKLIIRQSGTTIKSAAIIRSFKGILAGPELLLARALITSNISCSEIWAIIKSNWFLFLRNLVGDMLGTLGTDFSVTGPTFAKKLLKLLVIVTGSSITLPLIFNCEIEKSAFFYINQFSDTLPCFPDIAAMVFEIRFVMSFLRFQNFSGNLISDPVIRLFY